MENKQRNILIVTYYFPPDPSIGSRRWSKFAKYLHRAGNPVTILAAESLPGMKSPWDNDILELDVIRYKRNYPEILDSTPLNFWDKLKYRWAIFRLKRKVRGTIYDRAVFLEDVILKMADEIMMTRNIDVLIVNGPPHRIMYFGSILKERFPNLFLISDFRDPWTWWYNYGYPQLDKKNRLAEEFMERKVSERSDLILVTYPEMKSQIKQRYPDANIEIIPHGFDTDDFSLVKSNPVKGEKLRLVYFGTLYNGEENRFRRIASYLNLHKDVTFDIYSDTRNYFSLFKEIGCEDQVTYFNPIASDQLFERITGYDAVLMIMPDKFRNNFSSKFFEIVYSGLPLILVTAEGDLTEFLRKYKAGIAITDDKMVDLKSIFDRTKKLDRVKVPEILRYSFENLTQELLLKMR